jgi:hypothetical protein
MKALDMKLYNKTDSHKGKAIRVLMWLLQKGWQAIVEGIEIHHLLLNQANLQWQRLRSMA